ncbi:MAG: TonB family protein [Aridibacter famidurans]|nr:TonB family protein [Aridibacter famidurans]
MKLKISLVALLVLAVVSSVLAQDEDSTDDQRSGILYGKNHAYSVTAPTGWVLDNKAGVNQGVHAVFYPVGSSFARATAVMYTNVWMKDAEHPDLNSIIEADIRKFRERSENLKVSDAAAIAIDGGKKALVKHFWGDVHGNFEAIAYIDEPKLAVLFVLSSQTKKDFDTSLSAFEELVKSYSFLTEDVEIVEKERETFTTTGPPIPSPKEVPGIVSKGLLNGLAIDLPKPVSPAHVRAKGIVRVEVVVDEEGRVISATVSSGHVLLRAAAINAARKARFAPTLIEGKAVRISGVIVYQFK